MQCSQSALLPYCLILGLPYNPRHGLVDCSLEPYIRVKLRTGADKTFLAPTWPSYQRVWPGLARRQNCLAAGRGRRNQVVGRQLQISSTRMDPSNQTNTTIRRLVRLWKQKQLKIFLHYTQKLLQLLFYKTQNLFYDNSGIKSISPARIFCLKTCIDIISYVSIKSHLGIERTLL